MLKWWLVLIGLNAIVQLVTAVVLQFDHASAIIIELHWCQFAIWTVGWGILIEMAKWRRL